MASVCRHSRFIANSSLVRGLLRGGLAWPLGMTALLAGWFALLAAMPVRAQVSPGPLSRAHRAISGTTQCTACHQLGVRKAELKCFDCHAAIAQRIQQGRGLHARVVPRGSGTQSCAGCHSEHNGTDFNLIHWNPSQAGFDHRETGYPLEGKHAGLDCRKCHAPEKIPPAERKLIGDAALPRTFLGLSRECLTCHEDAHRGELDRDCQQCHGFNGWKPATGFNHAQTRYPLTGAHAEVACRKCHTAAGERMVHFRVAAFDRCSACHTDPHKAAFAAPCHSCHNTSQWKAGIAAIRFDHRRTDFPLQGKHAEVGCVACHRSADFSRELAHANCWDCHRPDPHGGQFVARADGGKCDACHGVEGFKPARFGLLEHAKTAYPLEGKHSTVSCAKCHPPAGKATRYKVSFARCLDCHQDAHERQFAEAPLDNRCEQCHTVHRFKPSTFTLARHQQSRFALTGAHAAVVCGECHRPAQTSRPGAAAPYHFADLSCETCHSDPHRGQFRERMAQQTNGAFSGCETCHTTRQWKDVSRFDHARTGFVLTGAHRAVACRDCHVPPNFETTLRNVVFRSAPKKCEECHRDVHGEQFADASRQTECAGCHATARWKPSLFDHDKRTAFPLEGGHSGVRCTGCHNQVREVAGRKVLFYKPTPKQCAACHGAEIAGAEDTAALTGNVGRGSPEMSKIHGVIAAEMPGTPSWRTLSLANKEFRSCGDRERLLKNLEGDLLETLMRPSRLGAPNARTQ
jgi:hypothetical protein